MTAHQAAALAGLERDGILRYDATTATWFAPTTGRSFRACPVCTALQVSTREYPEWSIHQCSVKTPRIETNKRSADAVAPEYRTLSPLDPRD